MKRTTRYVSAAVLGLVALALAPVPALAQVGPWSQQHPAWVDLNGNGQIDAGEVAMYPELVYNAGLPSTDPDALYIVLRNNPWDAACPNFVETRVNATPLFNPTTIVRRHGVMTDTVNLVTGTSFHLDETVPAPVPRRPRGALANTTTATGDGSFIDTDSDGVYDILRVSGMQGATPVPQTDLGFVFKDVNGDGKADWVSFPWGLTGVLGVKQSGGCLGGAGADPQVWLPLDDTNGDGTPIRVDVFIPNPANPNSPGGLTGIRIVPPRLAYAAWDVPTLSVWGLLALSAALASGGVLLLRGRAGAGA